MANYLYPAVVYENEPRNLGQLLNEESTLFPDMALGLSENAQKLDLSQFSGEKAMIVSTSKAMWDGETPPIEISPYTLTGVVSSGQNLTLYTQDYHYMRAARDIELTAYHREAYLVLDENFDVVSKHDKQPKLKSDNHLLFKATMHQQYRNHDKIEAYSEISIRPMMDETHPLSIHTGGLSAGIEDRFEKKISGNSLVLESALKAFSSDPLVKTLKPVFTKSFGFELFKGNHFAREAIVQASKELMRLLPIANEKGITTSDKGMTSHHAWDLTVVDRNMAESALYPHSGLTMAIAVSNSGTQTAFTYTMNPKNNLSQDRSAFDYYIKEKENSGLSFLTAGFEEDHLVVKQTTKESISKACEQAPVLTVSDLGFTPASSRYNTKAHHDILVRKDDHPILVIETELVKGFDSYGAAISKARIVKDESSMTLAQKNLITRKAIHQINRGQVIESIQDVQSKDLGKLIDQQTKSFSKEKGVER